MKPAQVRMARAGLNWSLADLAAAAGVLPEAISNFETQSCTESEEAVEAIRHALELAGIVFLDEDGEGPGVRLRKTRSGPSTIRVEDLNAENDE